MRRGTAVFLPFRRPSGLQIGPLIGSRAPGGSVGCPIMKVMEASKPENEAARLEALGRYDILDTLPETAFDDITHLAARICEAPVALVSLVDAARQWFKSKVGLEISETPLDRSFCAHALLQSEFLHVPDTRRDARFADNPLVIGPPHLRFYAGQTLVNAEGHPLGALCVLDYVPRALTDTQQETLRVLGRQVMAQLELRRHWAREKRIAETLQRAMLRPPEEGEFPGLEVAPIYEAAWDEANVGGDFFDLFALPGGRVALVVGDVSGKGLDAAARTAEVRYALRVYLREHSSPEAALARLNAYLCAGADPEGVAFVALTLAVVDPIGGAVTLAMAGAEPPLVARGDGRVEVLETGGLLLGIDPEGSYRVTRLRLAPGDLLLLMTDGIIEARRSGGAFFGSEGIEGAVGRADVRSSLPAIGRAVVEGARAFAGGTLHDDACLLLARLR